jgi:hypothetical protein
VKVLFSSAAICLVLVSACSSEESTNATSSSPPVVEGTVEEGRIADAEAIRIARAEIESAFEDFDFDQRRAQVVLQGDALDVSFPTTEPMLLEQEPHVILDAATGEVRERQVRG